MNFKDTEPDLRDMELSKEIEDRDRLARTLLTVVLGAVALRSFRKGKRLTGTLAGVGAVAVGYTATSESEGLEAEIGIETDSEDVELRCSACGEPIVPGQSRRPDENNEIVHEACMEVTE